MDNEIAISGTGIAGLAAATAVIAADRDCVLFGPPAQVMRVGYNLLQMDGLPYRFWDWRRMCFRGQHGCMRSPSAA